MSTTGEKMKLLTVFIHYPVCSGRYFTDALRRLGHDVRHIGDSTGTYIPWPPDGGHLPAKYAYPSDGGYTAHWDDWTPDLIILADSAFAYHHPVYQDVPHVVWGVDNHVRDYRQNGIAHYFLAHKNVSIQPLDSDVTWLPCAYDPAVFTPSPIPFADRQYDVCMLGVLYPQRVEILSALANAGLSVFAGTGEVYTEYAAAYHNARISLCVSARGDVAQRIFETAAMGCAILSDPLPDLIELNAPGIVLYNGVEDVVTQAKALLHAPELADTTQAWAIPQTWDARAQVIFDWYERTYRKPKGVSEEGSAWAIDLLEKEAKAKRKARIRE